MKTLSELALSSPAALTVTCGILLTAVTAGLCAAFGLLNSLAPALYYGDLDDKQRDAELTRFRSSACRFLVATQATGGHGLTLNEAHYAIFYENEFKYSHRIQAEDRCHRIGQVEKVTYVDIVSLSGIDERIQRALAKKEDVVKAFRRKVKKIRDVRI